MCITLKHHNKVKTSGKLKCVVLLAAAFAFASKHYTQATTGSEHTASGSKL